MNASTWYVVSKYASSKVYDVLIRVQSSLLQAYA